MKLSELAAMIDHTLLKPEAKPEDIERICAEANQYHFGAVCVNPVYVKLARSRVDRGVHVASVVGFPLGATPSEVKAYETRKAIEDGADEIDMVIHVGALKAGDLNSVEKDIGMVVDAANGKPVKVIIEACLLTDAEKEAACRASAAAGAAFVKTSTGFCSGGATVEDVRLMRRVVGDRLGVKASGGIRDFKSAMAMVEAGANRLGVSAGIRIIEEAQQAGLDR